MGETSIDVKTRATHAMLPAQFDTGTPLSACFKMPMICASLYRLFFIKISSDIMPEKFYS